MACTTLSVAAFTLGTAFAAIAWETGFEQRGETIRTILVTMWSILELTVNIFIAGELTTRISCL